MEIILIHKHQIANMQQQRNNAESSLNIGYYRPVWSNQSTYPDHPSVSSKTGNEHQKDDDR